MSKKLLTSNITTLVASVLAIALIGYGGIHAVQAAPRIESADYRAEVQLSGVYTGIVENGKLVVGEGALLQEWPKEGAFAVGKSFAEVLAVKNTGDELHEDSEVGIDEYVRVTVRTYWTDAEGNALKDTSLKPSYIKLHFLEDNGWSIDEDASTEERTVLYYKDILEVGETSKPFADALTISSEVSTAVSGDGAYAYEGVTFHIDVVADAVQTHNGNAAMMSAWGVTL